MTEKERYASAREIYAKAGVDTDAAIAKLKEVPVSLHCWQGDDVTGFDHDGPLTGGIQTTGNYPGKARTPQELMQDIEQVIRLAPGKKKLKKENLQTGIKSSRNISQHGQNLRKHIIWELILTLRSFPMTESKTD